MIVTKDKLVQSITDKFNIRANKGIIKFGNTFDQAKMDDEAALLNLQEELMDAVAYIEKILWNKKMNDDLKKQMSELKKENKELKTHNHFLEERLEKSYDKNFDLRQENIKKFPLREEKKP